MGEPSGGLRCLLHERLEHSVLQTQHVSPRECLGDRRSRVHCRTGICLIDTRYEIPKLLEQPIKLEHQFLGVLWRLFALLNTCAQAKSLADAKNPLLRVGS